MPTKQQHTLLILLTALMLMLPVNLDAAATRSIAGTACEPAVSVMVVAPDAGTSAWAYEEYVYGLRPSSISGDGIWLPILGVIRWGTFLDNSSRSFSYTLSGTDGAYSVYGKESRDGRDVDTGSIPVSILCNPPLEQAATPTFDPPGGTNTPTTVTISTTTQGATIYYTVNGTIPTASSTVYSGPILISERTLLQAFALKSGMRDSEVRRATYEPAYLPPAQTLERSVAGTACRAVVSITVAPAEGASAYAVEEKLPLELAPENISHNGAWDKQSSTVRWGVFLDGDARTLTYELTGPDAFYVLAGAGSFDGRSQNIVGSTQISIDCIPEQAVMPILNPGTGTRVPATITMTSATQEAEIRYTTDGSEPDETSVLYTTPVLLTAAATVKVKAFKEGLAPSNTTRADYLALKRPMAVIVAGSGPFVGNSLWPATQLVSHYAYLALLYQGYAKEDIQFLSSDLSTDVDGNGELDDIDAAATRTNLEQAITVWASNASELLLYFTGHGGDQTFMLEQLEILNAADLAAWLDTLQAVMSGRVTVIYDACQSGTFLSELVPPSGRERIVISSASNEPALFLSGGVLSFSYQFWASVFSSGKLYDAYLAARQLMLNDQRPLLDANGNGIANEKTDTIAAAGIVIGRGMLAASVPPIIQSFVSAQVLTGSSSATIWADNITTLDPINRAWAVILPPDYHPGAVNIPITDLPNLELLDPDQDGRFENTYTGFSLNGTYRLMIYAKDTQGFVSIPRETTVIQNGGVIPDNTTPTAQNMNFNTDEDLPVQGTLWASDADANTLNYIIVADGTKGTVTIMDVNSGSFVYQPYPNDHGTDTFTFKVNDGKVDSPIATVSITINALEDIPQAFDMTFAVDQNSSISDNLKGADGDEDPIVFAISDPTDHGIVVLHDTTSGYFTYTPSIDYFGNDAFTFTADDGKAVSQPGTVSITVNRGYNNPPAAPGGYFSGTEDTIFEGTLPGSDPDNDPLTFILVSAPVKGQVNLTDPSTGAFIYTPYADLNGDDSFTYKVSDGLAESDLATITLNIAAVNDIPIAKAGTLSVTHLSGTNGTLNATDVENDSLIFSLVSNGQMGQAVITHAASGAYTYTPYGPENGTDHFSFKVSDGESDSATAWISANIRLPQAEIERSVGGDGCMIAVSLSVNPAATVRSYAVAELIPDGVFPAGISDDGIWDPESRTIRWGVFLDSASRTLSYNLTGDDGFYAISGNGSFDGWDQTVTGQSQAEIACGAQRVATPLFDPADGARVPVNITLSSETAGAEIRFTTDGATPDTGSNLYTASLYLTEPVILKAKAFKEGMFASQTANARYLPTRSHKAILVAGGGPYPGNLLWGATRLVSEHAYKALLYQGYAKEDIIFLSAGGDVDIDGNGTMDDIDGPAASTALQAAITGWALDSESLLLYMTDHGGDSTFQLSPEDILRAADLDTWFDKLQATMPGRVVVVYDACRAGSFLRYLTPSPDQERIVITSASDENAWFIWGGKLSFSYQFWAAIFRNPNLYDAYDTAKIMMNQFQMALLDADGDGIEGEEDRLAAKDIVLGRGAVAAGVPPEIGYVSALQFLSTESRATIKAGNITSLNPIVRVWAVIVPPRYQPDSPDDPVTDMTEIDLAGPDENGIYEVVYEDFTAGGTYKIVVYAQDSEGIVSRPKQTGVVKGDLKGDLDKDGYADLADAILSLKIFVGMDVSGQVRPDYAASGADVNGDGKVGIEEVIFILQVVAGLR